MEYGPSAHLSWHELSCHDASRTPYPIAWRESRAVSLAAVFEQLRELAGVPLLVLSAYRTQEWNRRVGGAPGSQHVQGRALDLVAARPVTVTTLVRLAHEIAMRPGSKLRGLGFYPIKGFVHIDIRESDRLVTWGERDVPDM